MMSPRYLCVFLTFQVLKRMSDFLDMWYECHATGRQPKLIDLNFLQSVKRIWRTYELMMWERL
jgi:hypothetical protein